MKNGVFTPKTLMAARSRAFFWRIEPPTAPQRKALKALIKAELDARRPT
jgi:hypothetical protein